MRYKKLYPDARTPIYSSRDAAGADLFAYSYDEITIAPKETILIHTGIAVEIPAGYVGLVFARSSLGTKRGLAPANKVGVIDADYRGEIMVSLHNHSDQMQIIIPFERIAQLVIVPYMQETFVEVDILEDTQRGSGGFGSTGRA